MALDDCSSSSYHTPILANTREEGSEEGSALLPWKDTFQKSYLIFLPVSYWSELSHVTYLAVFEGWKYPLSLGHVTFLTKKKIIIVQEENRWIRKRKFTWNLTSLYSEVVVKMMVMIIPCHSSS